MEFPSQSQFFFNSPKGKIHYRWYRSSNESSCVCVLPGFSFPASLYHNFALGLYESGYSVIVVDYWGRGHTSAQRDDEYTLESNRSLVVSLLEHLSVNKCTFVGFSYGCAVAALIAATKNEIVNKIVLCSPFHCNGEPITPLQQLTLSIPILGNLVFKFSARRNVPFSLENQISERPNKKELIDTISPHIIQHSISRSSEITQSIGSFDLSQVERAIAGLVDINKQILVLCGSKDKIIHVEQCQVWWSKWVPNSSFLLIPNSGHLIFLEEPAATLAAIKQFLK
ncbi:Clan SC, family S33, methylesterase-like serine peptidase [Trichomonas vaginalis G3]|uniref:Clan SC, family S33, methylesterase-like serine peptidase n=1 Tax=Trichomonas vaginalis (strain ATCC PRA-98 / G3) TaxID=412133 RepID=A2EGC5_TRIV3|nr:Clan SC, family S33, methylesterase-like serine peptidase [Trichomonas vaginalis G3]EAY08304.1 Clan SC, family S33, methylesterase-like serine peptidase [Trichomonas vaginalis G3]KAI5546097.1 Clan SC, family S33, methylesterase-like serine peptidase [Trichomonas vaginalis G3]|eukprot:XP_001320527.1 Clan SC, family S33, methylesterase-like serine peptidase [Trichomonas vaginalis G3]